MGKFLQFFEWQGISIMFLFSFSFHFFVFLVIHSHIFVNILKFVV